MSLYMTPRQVAVRWGCSARHVRRLLESGKLAGLRLGSLWRIAEDAASAYELAHTSGSASSTSDEGRKAEVVRPVFGVLAEATGPLVLPERWWEGETASPRTRKTKKAASQRH